MSYTALYRKFRPDNFSDVKGQDHIVTTLKNQIAAQRIGHAYLFCGTRGTGKTTIAKLFAKTVNCENPIDQSPCGECASCKAIAAGASMNVIEIDAASNNGVDNIREIVDEVSYSPVDGKYKVYIIDEVHMLSLGAFNALLKTLEEPPSYVIFILATTEVHKIPITILSRCQRYDFKRISIETITSRLQELTAIEKVDVEERALRYIARAGDGSMRDALSLLDQCIAFHYGETLTYDMALDVLGAVDTEVFSELLRRIVADDIIGCMELLENIVMQGRELSQFVTDFTWYLRNLMLLKSSTDEHVEEVLDVSTEHLKRLKEEADMLELETVYRYITIFAELSGRLRYATQKRILLEMTLIKLCRPQMENNQDAIIERIRKVEEQLERGVSVVVHNQESGTNQVQASQAKTQDRQLLPAAIPDDIKRIVREWPTIYGMTENLTRSILSKAKLSMGEQGQLLLCFPDKIMAGQMEKTEKQQELNRLLEDYIGKEVTFEIRDYDKTQNFSNHFVDLGQVIGMDYEEE
ncbi:MAG TPA: DNA polymerase III subunit gamma/tau [Lachnospiraceae bacterium]|nr:DNA polymerase III subunit gamma/tau [Lachnospiraceae bacterium]